ncbi:hypothetical protein Tsubulata_026663 [Turnera subulata]|uniref:Uncharacterized protein n=1 Tax=Turnera subulata TaxID=218843 RepID=A0A9Q0G0J6_9ROSI|nr:hypothetical protein Tsubulata_026663 [Turnera subulata]
MTNMTHLRLLFMPKPIPSPNGGAGRCWVLMRSMRMRIRALKHTYGAVHHQTMHSLQNQNQTKIIKTDVHLGQ